MNVPVGFSPDDLEIRSGPDVGLWFGAAGASVVDAPGFADVAWLWAAGNVGGVLVYVTAGVSLHSRVLVEKLEEAAAARMVACAEVPRQGDYSGWVDLGRYT